jgi:sugar phosphate isomerase/epimerase
LKSASDLPHRHVSRRRFLALSAAGAAGASLFEAAELFAEGVPGPQREYAWFPMGIQSYSLRGFAVETTLDYVQKLGIHHVEFFSGHFAINPEPKHIAAMLRSVRRRDMAISAHGVNRFTSDHEANRRVFEFANLAGIRNLSADPDPDSFESLEKLVAEYGIRIAIHNHGPGNRYDKVADVKKAIKDRHAWIGACADLGHFIRSGEDPVAVIRELEGRLYGIHLKDFAEKKKDAKGVVIGKGQLDVAETFRALRRVRFPADGALSLEYEENPENPLADLKECLEAAAEAARRAQTG